MKEYSQNSGTITAIKWGLFGATATVCAIILPIFIWQDIHGALNASYPEWIIATYIGFIYFCALYHSLYRIKVLFEDFGFKGLRLSIMKNTISTLFFFGLAGIILVFIKILI